MQLRLYGPILIQVDLIIGVFRLSEVVLIKCEVVFLKRGLHLM
jgi:hypothetical protein